MAESQIIERSEAGTVIRTGGGNGQRVVLPHVLPILPIRNIVVFPGTVMPLNVGRQKSKALLDEVMPGEKIVGVCTQKVADVEDPGYNDLFTVGCACVILKLFKLPDGNQSIIVHGLTRYRLLAVEQTDPFMTGRIEVLEDNAATGPGLDALVASVRQQANRVIELSPNTPDEAAQVLNSITNPSALADFLARQPAVRRVLYPGRADHPDHAVARRLFGDQFGNMVTFEIAGGRDTVNRFMQALQSIPFAPTLGDVSTIISHPAVTSHRGLTAAARDALGIHEGTIRVSVGVEALSLLEDEFLTALSAVAPAGASSRS